MALPIAPNVTVDVYRGFSAASPYPLQGTAAALGGVPAHLKHHLKAGRFGYLAPKLHWTHLLLVDVGTDMRGAYNSLVGPAEPTQNADTVLIKDYPRVGECTAFFVVLVQRAGRGSPVDHLRVYLDRLQPSRTGCFTPGVAASCGNCSILPQNWRVRTASDFMDAGCANCASLNNGSWLLAHTTGCDWQSADLPAICATGGAADGPVRWHLYLQPVFGWRLFLENDLEGILSFDPIAPPDFACAGPNTFVNPLWLFNTCASTASLTIERQ